MTAWPYSTREWRDRVRPACLARDGHTCRGCGRHATELDQGETLIADHVTPWRDRLAQLLADGLPLAAARQLAAFDLAGLQTLCSTCSGRKDGPLARRLRAGERRRGMVPVR